MMDTNDAIKLLKGMQGPLQDYADMVGAPGSAKGIRYVYPDPEDYAIEAAISALEEQDKHRWIPVEERLPEPNTRVLVTLKHHRWISDYGSVFVPEDEKIDYQEYTEVCEAVYMPDIGWKYAEAEADYGEAFAFVKPEKDMSCPIVEVIAWQPLPEPYRREGN